MNPDAGAWQRVVRSGGTAAPGSLRRRRPVSACRSRVRRLAVAAHIPVRLGYLEPETRPFLTGGVPFPRIRHATLQATDLARAVARTFAGDQRSAARRRPEHPNGDVIALREEDRRAARNLLQSSSVDPHRAVVLHPGTGWSLKDWPPDRWGRLAAELARGRGLRPLVSGLERERPLVEGVVARSGGSAIPLVETLPLGGFAALLEIARLVVACDSGPVHLAALVGTPVVALFGPASVGVAGPWCRAAADRESRPSL